MWKVPLLQDVEEIFKRASDYVGAMMLHRVAGVKNTNRLEYYLSRDIPIVEISKRFVLEKYSSPSDGVRRVSLTKEK